MADLKIEKHKWQPDFSDEVWILDEREQDTFKIILKQGDDIEIVHDWDYGYRGRGSERVKISVELLKKLIKELGM